MAVTIQRAYVDGFRDVLRHLAQQKTSKLRSWCDEYSPEAETGNWDRLGSADADVKTRKMATPDSQRPWTRRVAIAAPYNDAEFTEVEDPSLMLIDPNTQFVRSLGYAMGRKMDDIIIAAAKGSALEITRDPDDGTTADGAHTKVAVAAANIVGDYSAPISFDYLTEVQEVFNAADVDMEEPRVAVVGPRQVRELMQLTEQTSADYVQARALQQNGIVPNWMGFTWIMSTRLNNPTPVTDQGNCLFFTRQAMGFHIPQDITTFIERDPGLSYAWRPYCQFTAGSVRVEDEHLIWGKFLDESIA